MLVGSGRSPDAAACPPTVNFRIRMRSQVQVLAGPPAIVAAQSAVGSKPGTLAGCLGRAGAARPSPPARPSAPPGPSTRPAGATTTTHRGRAPIPRTAVTRPVRQPHAAASSRAHSAAAGDGRSACRPGLPGRPASSAAAARTRPGPGPPPTARRPWVTAAASPASGPARPSTEPLDDAAPQGPGPVPVVGVALPHRPVPQRHRLMGDQTDGGVDTRGLNTGGVDTRRPDAGSRTTNPGDWTPDGPDSRASDDGTGWVDTACWTRTGDRGHGWRPGMVEHGDGA
jgi:hypothetical protein